MNSLALRLQPSHSCLRASRTVSSWKSLRPESAVLVRSRHVHTRRKLPYPIDNGLGSFLSPEGLKTLAIDYQEGLLERLNDQVKESPEMNQSLVQTILNTARDRNKVLAFNYATQAFNNSFFLDNLAPLEEGQLNHEHKMSQLIHKIKLQYGSIDQMKSSVAAAATGIFSSGWVWFVTDTSGNLGVIPTFGTGTLLVRSSRQMAGNHENDVLGVPEPGSESAAEAKEVANHTDPNPVPHSQSSHPTPTSPTSGLSHSPSPLNPSTPSRTFHATPSARAADPFSSPASSLWDPLPLSDAGLAETTTQTIAKSDIASIGETLIPLFCISVYEHAWLSSGYGIWGKEEYLKRFWTVLDWGKVEATYQKFGATSADRR
ncbi:hypothetical protein JAAARDRAFT_167828 [Jaapia argillacea MUCL 33604]|uniref:Manganese/iron superoxide dismutase C-terminal domain-containing protein n=1 Tax=Jaapia argillacea MUCL 33604 TaxID=933084 RepID=A0A067QQR6_9AGAM|nr:hypothetical protein JAAARDRAFT_167828 [Jaapia argillacea MUCL 33604]